MNYIIFFFAVVATLCSATHNRLPPRDCKAFLLPGAQRVASLLRGAEPIYAEDQADFVNRMATKLLTINVSRANLYIWSHLERLTPEKLVLLGMSSGGISTRTLRNAQQVENQLGLNRGTAVLPFPFAEWLDQSGADILDVQRKGQYGPSFSPAMASGITPLDRKAARELLEAIGREFQALDVEQQYAFTLIAMEHLTHGAAARRMLGRTDDEVKVLVENAWIRLAEAANEPSDKELQNFAVKLCHSKKFAEAYARQGRDTLQLRVVREFVRLFSLIPMKHRHAIILHQLYGASPEHARKALRTTAKDLPLSTDHTLDLFIQQWEWARYSEFD